MVVKIESITLIPMNGGYYIQSNDEFIKTE